MRPAHISDWTRILPSPAPFGEQEQSLPRRSYADCITPTREGQGIYGSGTASLDDMKIYEQREECGFYFREPDGHVLEVLAASGATLS
jgi:hypothetical protein